MKIGIGVAFSFSHYERFWKCFNESVSKLDPKPDCFLPYFNKRGLERLKEIRSRIYDKLFFDCDCDVVLSCDADFYLFPKILRYVDGKRIVSFCFFPFDRHYHLSTLLFIMLKRSLTRLLWKPNAWAGCFSLPRRNWNFIRRHRLWDGTDSSIHRIAKDFMGYSFVLLPKYYLLELSSRTSYSHLLDYKPITKRILGEKIRIGPIVEKP